MPEVANEVGYGAQFSFILINMFSLSPIVYFKALIGFIATVLKMDTFYIPNNHFLDFPLKLEDLGT